MSGNAQEKTATPQTGAVLLAAGMSTRMGAQNKLLLPFGRGTMIGHMVGVLRAARLTELVVVLGHEADQVRAALEAANPPDAPGCPLRVVEHPHFAEGMGSSLKAGLRALSAGLEAVMVCLTDQPLLETADVNRLVTAMGTTLTGQGGKNIIVPFHGGQRGNPVLFSAHYLEEVLATRGPIAGCRGIVQRYPNAVLAVEMETDHILRDIDTPEDYQALMASLEPPANPRAAATNP